MSLTDEEKDEVVCIGVRIKKDLYEQLRKVCESKDLTLSQVVRIVLKEFINKETS